MSTTRIGIVAPSSCVSREEFHKKVLQLQKKDWHLEVHPQVFKKHLFFAGTHLERARAFYEYGSRKDIDVIWCARGGTGAGHLLNYLDRWGSQKISRRKLLVGYSDATVLMEYVRKKWGWSTLHATMLGETEKRVDHREMSGLKSWMDGRCSSNQRKLKFVSGRPRKSIQGKLVGGNLTLIQTLIGTPHIEHPNGKFLFLEDIGETLYRLDRTVSHLKRSGYFKGVKALVLGDFWGCEDRVPMVASGGRRKPLRKKVSTKRGLEEIFGQLGKECGFPVLSGFPAGHGPRNQPLALGANYEIRSNGVFELKHWNWAPRPGAK